jgi:hypothetical protein
MNLIIWSDMILTILLVIRSLMIDLCYNGVSIELSVWSVIMIIYWLICHWLICDLFIIYWLIFHLLIDISSIICLSIDWLVNYWLIYHLLIDLSSSIDWYFIRYWLTCHDVIIYWLIGYHPLTCLLSLTYLLLSVDWSIINW